MKRLSILVYFAFSSWAYAQEQSCISRTQFLRGEFSSDSVPCDQNLVVPLKYCNANTLSPSERDELFIASELRNYFPPVQHEEASIEAKLAQADLLRYQAFADEENSDSVTGIFYILYTAILAAHLSEFAAEAGIEEDFWMLVNRRTERRYFLRLLPRTVSELEHLVECAVRCGDVEASMEKLTRSPVFRVCVEGE